MATWKVGDKVQLKQGAYIAVNDTWEPEGRMFSVDARNAARTRTIVLLGNSLRARSGFAILRTTEAQQGTWDCVASLRDLIPVETPEQIKKRELIAEATKLEEQAAAVRRKAEAL